MSTTNLPTCPINQDIINLHMQNYQQNLNLAQYYHQLAQASLNAQDRNYITYLSQYNYDLAQNQLNAIDSLNCRNLNIAQPISSFAPGGYASQNVQNISQNVQNVSQELTKPHYHKDLQRLYRLVILERPHLKTGDYNQINMPLRDMINFLLVNADILPEIRTFDLNIQSKKEKQESKKFKPSYDKLRKAIKDFYDEFPNYPNRTKLKDPKKDLIIHLKEIEEFKKP